MDIMETTKTTAEKAGDFLANIGNTLYRWGGALARWAGTQSWWRLFVFAILLLVAQGIILDNFEDPPTHHHHRHHSDQAAKVVVNPSTGIDIHDDQSQDHVHIGWTGITVDHPNKSASPDAAASGTETRPETASPVEPPRSLPAPASTPPAAPTPPNAAITPVAPVPSDASKMPSSDKVDTVNTDDEESDTDDEPTRTRGDRGRAVIESLVMLLIVFAIGAKLLARQTQKTEERATEAEAFAERAALEKQLAQARLQALQAQVEPHFLFNTLASVDYLIESDPPRASQMQKHLIQYLRSALPQMRDGKSNLGREFDLSRSYLEIMKMRMEDRLSLSFELPDGLRSADFPPMMLQSLVENAISHGLEPSAQGGQVSLSAQVIDGLLEVRVSDTGIGLAAAANQKSGTGLGLQNIRERLSSLYPQHASLELKDNTPTGAIAIVRIPYQVAIA